MKSGVTSRQLATSPQRHSTITSSSQQAIEQSTHAKKPLKARERALLQRMIALSA